MSLPVSPREAAFAFASSGDWTRAVPAARDALARDPQDASAHALLALGLAHQNQSRQAVEAGRRAVALEPELAFAHHALGWALLQHDDVAGAERAARESLRLDPDADAYALLGQVHARQRRWKDVLEAAARGLEVDAQHAGCTNLRALALGNLGHHDQARAAVSEALAADPEDAYSHANHGWLLLRAARYDEALEAFRTALRLDASMEWARLGIVEALKARHGAYRLILRYSLWMGSLDGRTRWWIIIGLFVGGRIARAALRENPALAPVLVPVLVAYGLFVASTWLADPLSNLLLRLNPFGRLALTKAETLASNLVGGLLACAAISGLLFAGTGTTGWIMLTAVSVLMLMPVSGTFGLHGTRAFTPLLAVTAALGASGAAAVVMSFLGLEIGVWALVALAVGAFLFGWVVNYFSAKYL